MTVLPSSPRARRRVLGLGAVALLVLAGLAVALLVPSTTPPKDVVTGKQGSAIVVSQRTTRLTAADRRAITATLNAFLPAAMERRSATTAWKLAGPELRGAVTPAQLRKGDSPIPYYPARETTFDHWKAITVEPGSVIFNILLHAEKGSKLPPYVFSGQVVKRHGTWLVNHVYTIAIMWDVTETTHEVGPADFAAPPATSQTPQSDKAALGKIGLVPVLGLLALVLLVPLALGGVALRRRLRWRRHVRASGRTELPPLPSAYRAARAQD